MSMRRGYRSINIKKVFHYFILVLLAIVMIIPAAVLIPAAPIEASPSAPTLISPANGYATNVTTVTLKWSAPAGATSYDVWVDNRSDFHNNDINSIVFHKPGTSTEVTIPFSLADGKYYWKVGAFGTWGGSTGWSKWSSVYNFTVDTVAPGVPSQVSPTNDSASTNPTPTLDWNTVTGAVSYEWEISTDDWLRVPYSSGTTTSSSYTFTKPLTFGRYFWQVRAIDAAGNIGAWSLGKRFFVLGSPQFTQPADGSAFNTYWIEFEWKYVYDVNYDFQMDNNSDFSSPLVSIQGTPFSSYNLEWRVDGTYYCRFRGLAGGVTGLWSPVLQITVDTVPPAVPAQVSPANGAGTFMTPTLDWNAASGASSYEWQIATNANFSPLYSSGTTSSTDYTFPSYLPGNLYYWRVRAVDLASNKSAWTPVWQFYVTPTLTVSPVTAPHGGTVDLSATLQETASGTLLAGKTIYFRINGANVGSAVTDDKGLATLSGVSLEGNSAGTYPEGIGARFMGDSIYNSSYGTAQLQINISALPPPPSVPGQAATGAGWYTLEDRGRVNFSFNVNRIPNTSEPVENKGEFLLINDGRWRLKGTLNTYRYLGDSQGYALGNGQLYYWDSNLKKGQGDWVEVLDDLGRDTIGFGINFYDVNMGKAKDSLDRDKFGIDISIDVPAGAPPLPNSSPALLEGGNIDIKDLKK